MADDLTLAQARAYLQGKIATLTGAPAYEYERLITTEEELKSLAGVYDAKGDRAIELWMLSVESDSAISDTLEGVPEWTFHRIYTLVAHGYRGLDDSQASGVYWQDQIERVLNGLDNDPTLGGNCDYMAPPQGRIRGQFRMYGNILCHYAEIACTITQRRDRVL